jgi:hypothetical protein
VVPPRLSHLRLSNLRLREARLDIEVQGRGARIVRVEVDGRSQTTPWLPLTAGAHHVRVTVQE